HFFRMPSARMTAPPEALPPPSGNSGASAPSGRPTGARRGPRRGRERPLRLGPDRGRDRWLACSPRIGWHVHLGIVATVLTPVPRLPSVTPTSSWVGCSGASGGEARPSSGGTPHRRRSPACRERS